MRILTSNNKYLLLLTVIFLSLSFTSCLKDPSPTSVDYNISDTAFLLHYLEEQGNYINSGLAPSTINADQIYPDPELFKIIDLRNTEKFEQGRIPTSINLKTVDLLSYFENSTDDSTIVVLVSESGQISGYLTSLFRLMGYYNVYSLNFGIASWHNDFAEEVFLEREILSSNFVSELTNTNFPKLEYSPLPELNLGSSDNIKETLISRINSVWNNGFIIQNLPIGDKNTFIMCYGDLNLYKAHSIEGPTPGEGHPIGAVHYLLVDRLFELNSTKYLQTIPSNKRIITYSYSGQLGAFIAAYLRVLGYDAYSLNYGASQFIYERLVWSDYTKVYVFDESKVMNFPYEK